MYISGLSRKSVMAVVLAVVIATTGQQAYASCLPSTEKTSIKTALIEAAKVNGTVPPGLALAVGRVESNFNATALSRAGARGVMQIMPATGRHEFGLEPDELWDPCTNIDTGLAFLSLLYELYDQNWNLALSHYNGGSLKKLNGSYVIHAVTRDYIEKVDHFWQFYADDKRYLCAEPSRFLNEGSAEEQPAVSCREYGLEPGFATEPETRQPTVQAPVWQSPTRPRFLLDPSEAGNSEESMPETSERVRRFGWTNDAEVSLNGENRFR